MEDENVGAVPLPMDSQEEMLELYEGLVGRHSEQSEFELRAKAFWGRAKVLMPDFFDKHERMKVTVINGVACLVPKLNLPFAGAAKTIGRWVVGILLLGLCAFLYSEHRVIEATNTQLREQAALQKRVMNVQDVWCEGIQEVNVVCESWVVMMIERLGLDEGTIPVLTSAMKSRSHFKGQGPIGPTK